jgi:hypothetical protein
MGTLDRAFGGSGNSAARAYASLSRLAGLLFLAELLAVTAWTGFSRKSCRYAGLCLALPSSLLYFGYYELGYLALGVGVVPLLATARRRSFVAAGGPTLAAGLLQGLHAALHGFGLIGLAGGALRTLVGPGGVTSRLLQALTFVSAGVAMYAGWAFVYIVMMKMSIVIDNAVGGFGLRHMFDVAVYDRRIAYPVLSFAGLGEIGLISALAGVPLLALGMLRSSRAVVVAGVGYALPGLLFLIAWWPPGAPYNLDLIMAAFPGVFAGCWLSAASRRRTIAALALILIVHVLFWTNVGSTVFDRIWVDPMTR